MDYLLTWFNAASSSMEVAAWLIFGCLILLVVYEYGLRHQKSNNLRKQEQTRQRVVNSQIEERVVSVLETAVTEGHLDRSDVLDFYKKNKFYVPLYIIPPPTQTQRFPNLTATGRWFLDKFTFRKGEQSPEKKERLTGLIVRKS